MRKKTAKIITLISILLIGVIFVGLVLFQQFGPKRLLTFLKNRVEVETNSRYTLTLDSLDFDLWSLSVHLGSLQLERDTSVQSYSGISLLDKFDVYVDYKSLDVNYFNLFRFVFYNTIKVSEFKLVNPYVELIKNRSYDPEASEAAAQPESQSIETDRIQADSILADTLAYQEFQESGSVFMPTLIVEDLLIAEADFLLFDGRKPKPIQEIRGLSLHLQDVHSDQDAPFSAEDLSIAVDSASTLVAKNTAELELFNLFVSPDSFHMDSMHYGHIIDPYRINRFKGFRAAWMDIQIQDLDLKGVHYDRMIADTALLIDRITVGNLWLNMFKDKAEKKINPAHKALPAELIRSVPLDLEIDTLEVVHANLHVEMQAAKAIAPGYIDLMDLYLIITNLTNMEEALAKNPIMEVYAEGNIMQAGPVSVDFKFDLPSAEDHYTARASAGPMDIRAINNFLGSQFFIEFKSGYVEEMTFEYEGNNKANVGQMDLEYRNLKVQKLQDFEQFLEGHPHTGFFAGIGNMLVPKNRSKDQKKYKTAVVYYEKEYNRDVIHGLIQSMLSGIMSSVGLASKNLEKKMHQAENLTKEDTQKSAAKAQHQAEKVDRKEQKQAARKKRKAEREAKRQKKNGGM